MPFENAQTITKDDRLPWDNFRCNGSGCERKDSCLRHIELRNMGPRTAIVETACHWSHVGTNEDWYLEVK